MATVHASPYGGSWYPGEAGELRELLERVWVRSCGRTGPFLLPSPLAFVAPHAGLIYSGTVAAAVYRHIEQAQPERVVLLGFSHRGGPAGVAVPDIHAFTTPLGAVKVDREAASSLPFPMVPESRLCDHSVEIQLPLLQKAVPEARVVPLYVGPMGAEQRDEAAQALASLAGARTVFVASSDLTHYGRSFGYEPFRVDSVTADNLRVLDHEIMAAAGSLDARYFLENIAATRATVCGYDPISLLLRTLRSIGGEEIFQQVLDYQTSGEITGDFHHCVSYGALGYFPVSSFELAAGDRGLLAASARQTLARFMETGERKPVRPERITPALTRHAGAFVSLHEGGELRGCVGERVPRAPLCETIADLTLSAALDDPRFKPLEPCPGGEVDIEISVLSPFRRIRDRKEFEIGVHGAYLENGRRRALLLPQVAAERDWTPALFWEMLARKAGANSSIYGDSETRIEIFRARIFEA